MAKPRPKRRGYEQPAKPTKLTSRDLKPLPEEEQRVLSLSGFEDETKTATKVKKMSGPYKPDSGSRVAKVYFFSIAEHPKIWEWFVNTHQLKAWPSNTPMVAEVIVPHVENYDSLSDEEKLYQSKHPKKWVGGALDARKFENLLPQYKDGFEFTQLHLNMGVPSITRGEEHTTLPDDRGPELRRMIYSMNPDVAPNRFMLFREWNGMMLMNAFLHIFPVARMEYKKARLEQTRGDGSHVTTGEFHMTGNNDLFVNIAKRYHMAGLDPKVTDAFIASLQLELQIRLGYNKPRTKLLGTG